MAWSLKQAYDYRQDKPDCMINTITPMCTFVSVPHCNESPHALYTLRSVCYECIKVSNPSEKREKVPGTLLTSKHSKGYCDAGKNGFEGERSFSKAQSFSLLFRFYFSFFLFLQKKPPKPLERLFQTTFSLSLFPPILSLSFSFILTHFLLHSHFLSHSFALCPNLFSLSCPSFLRTDYAEWTGNRSREVFSLKKNNISSFPFSILSPLIVCPLNASQTIQTTHEDCYKPLSFSPFLYSYLCFSL